jgi:hypothetical protein
MTEKPKPIPKPEDIELHPDAWERFERAVDVVMRPRPKPKPAKARAPLPERDGKPDEKEPA